MLGDPTGKYETPRATAPRGPATSELRSPGAGALSSVQPGSRFWRSTEPGVTSLTPSGRIGPLAPNPALSPLRACAGRNAGPSTFSRAGKIPNRGVLQWRGQLVPCGVRLWWGLGNRVASFQPALPRSSLQGFHPLPTVAGRGFGKETVTTDPFGTWSEPVTPPCRRVSTCVLSSGRLQPVSC